MTDPKGDKAFLEQTEYVYNVNLPAAPGQMMYYPSKPTPEFLRKVKVDKAIGMVVIIFGLVLMFVGMTFLALNWMTMLLPIIAIVALVLAIIFVARGNVALIKTARALPVVGGVVLAVIVIINVLLIVFAVQTMMGTFQQQAAQQAAQQAQGGGQMTFNPEEITKSFSDYLFSTVGVLVFSGVFIGIGFMLMRGGATMLWDLYRLRTDFSPAIIVVNAPPMRPPTDQGYAPQRVQAPYQREPPREEYKPPPRQYREAQPVARQFKDVVPPKEPASTEDYESQEEGADTGEALPKYAKPPKEAAAAQPEEDQEPSREAESSGEEEYVPPKDERSAPPPEYASRQQPKKKGKRW